MQTPISLTAGEYRAHLHVQVSYGIPNNALSPKQSLTAQADETVSVLVQAGTVPALQAVAQSYADRIRSTDSLPQQEELLEVLFNVPVGIASTVWRSLATSPALSSNALWYITELLERNPSVEAANTLLAMWDGSTDSSIAKQGAQQALLHMAMKSPPPLREQIRQAFKTRTGTALVLPARSTKTPSPDA
jgi:hypothetical protein